MNSESIESIRHLVECGRYAEALDLLERDSREGLGGLEAPQLALVADLLDTAGLHVLSDSIYRRLLADMPGSQAVIYRFALSAFSQGDLAETLDRGGLVAPEQWRLVKGIDLMVRAAIKAGRYDEAKRLLARGLGLRSAPNRGSLMLLAAKIAYWVDEDPGLVLQLHGGVADHAGTSMKRLAALAAADTGDYSRALRLLGLSLEKQQEEYAPDDLICAYEIMRRAGNLPASLQWLSFLFLSQGLSPLLPPSSPRSGFGFAALRCSLDLARRSATDQLVSVIMTMHDWHELSGVAIRSILDQTHANLELIVVVDGPVDARVDELLDDWSKRDQRVRTSALPENRGTYVAKNHGMDMARGELIAFMDCDDWSHPQRLERAVALLCDPGSGLQAVCDDSVRLNHDGSLAYRDTSFARYAPISLVIKREPVLTSIGYFEAVRCSGDSEFCERIVAAMGEELILFTKTVTIIQSFSERSLTGGGEYAYDWRGLTGDRFAYMQAFRSSHKASRSLNLDMRVAGNGHHRTPGIPRSILSDVGPSSVERAPAGTAGRLPNLSAGVGALDVAHHPMPRVAVPTRGWAETDAVAYLVCNPGGERRVGHAVSSLLNQTRPLSALVIVLNDCGVPGPLPEHPRMQWVGIDEVDDHEHGLNDPLVFLASDEVLYPPDYVARMTEAVNSQDGGVVAGVEGAALPAGALPATYDELVDRQRLHGLSHAGSREWIVNFLNPAALAYRDNLVDAGPAVFLLPPLGGARLAVYAQERRIPMLTVRRDDHWLQTTLAPHAVTFSNGMLEAARWQNEYHALLSGVGCWRLFDICERTAGAAERQPVREQSGGPRYAS